MKRKLLTAILIILFVLSFTLIGCKVTGEDENGSNTNVEENAPPEQTCTHEYEDVFTCHDRECTKCDYVLVATTSHSFIDGVCDCNTVEENYETSGLVFTLINFDTEYEVSGYVGSATRIAIPNTHENKPVTRIGNNAFEENEYITNVVIQNGITEIGDFTFFDCVSLSKIRLPSTLNSIGEGAFGCTKLQNVIFPQNLVAIGDHVLRECEYLVSVTIPKTATKLGKGLFVYTPKLVEVCVAEDNPKYKDINGIFYTKDGSKLLQYPAGKTETTFNIPSSVTIIDYTAFTACASLKYVVIPNGVTSIGEYAFAECLSLESIIIPNSVTSIGAYTFFRCASLEIVVIPNSVTDIGDEAFDLCDMLTIYCEVTSKPSGWGSEWRDSRIPVVWNCLSNEVAEDGYIYIVTDGIRFGIKNGVATVVEQPKDIITVNIPSSITYKGQSYSVTSIDSSAFGGCTSLESVVIPNSVTSIGNYAFSGCSSLIRIVIPNSVTNIGFSAFDSCNKLTIYCYASSKPDGWSLNWNSSMRPVIWGHENLNLYEIDGDYIYFGSYPQTLKDDGVNVSDLTDENGYFIGSDGEKYAKIVATPYKTSYKFDSGSQIIDGETYYFKVEPIRWRILSQDNDKALLKCDSILINKNFDTDSNDYATSDVREWLISEFFGTAFTPL